VNQRTRIKKGDKMEMNVRIVPFNGKWAIEEDGDIQVRIVHNSKSDAILEGKKLARLYNTDLTLLDADGVIHDIYL
jgi:hypothetical protein